MLFVLGASGLGLLALPALARRAGRRLYPTEWARLCLIAVAGGGAVVELAAVLYALPTLATASHIAVLAVLCHRMLEPLAPGGPAAGWAATAVAVSLPVLGWVGWARSRRSARAARIERWLGRHEAYGCDELVVLPTDRAVAVSVPVLPGQAGRDQIVVSEGLLDTLTPEQLDAVLRHEVAHLRRGHHHHLAVAAVVDHAFAWFPPTRASTATLRLALERSADEEAASTCGDRDVVREALVAVTASLVAGPGLAAFSAAETIGERLHALDDVPPHPRFASHLLLYCPGAVLGAVALAAVWSWGTGASAVLSMAGTCFS